MIQYDVSIFFIVNRTTVIVHLEHVSGIVGNLKTVNGI